MFTVPVPRWDDEAAAAPEAPGPAVTQAIPAGSPSREPLATVPLPTFVPYAAEPPPTDTPTPAVVPAPALSRGTGAGTVPAEAEVDPLLGAVGVALFWMTVGWWVFVLVRVLGRVARVGGSDRLLIDTVDRYVEETIIAAILSVLAALLLLLSRGRSGRDALGWSALALAVVTVGVAVWRVLP
ncbi:hypothetical protein N865_08635 [Intrasporangium oryzae NRRL B-24470]|uniref:Uncharacterized protein n=2 Tax=Intrasporangium TaxID=53357 RepID=W9G7Z6_9MICO|nr:hypothetical protein N865_08635 [Intrasporangium oryzae NRRL B-24470]